MDRDTTHPKKRESAGVHSPLLGRLFGTSTAGEITKAEGTQRLSWFAAGHEAADDPG